MKFKLHWAPICVYNLAAILGDPSENILGLTCGYLRVPARKPREVHAAWEVISSLANCIQAGMSENHSQGPVEGVRFQMPGSTEALEYRSGE